MALSADQVYALARKAGLPTGRAVVATAIAGYAGSPHPGESGGDPSKHNAVPPDDSWGLWQLNMIGALGPARRVQFGIRSNAELLNPETNARAMASVSSRGLNFHPWTVFEEGSYQANLAGAKAAAGKVEKQGPDFIDKLVKGALAGLGPVGAAASLITDPLDAAKEIVSALNSAYRWLPGGPKPSTEDVAAARHGLLRIGLVLGGAILLIIAIGTLLEPLVKPALRIAQKIPGSPVPG